MDEGSRTPFLSPVQPHMGARARPSRPETNTVPAGHCRSDDGSSKWPRRKTVEPAGALVNADASSNAPRQIEDRDATALIQTRGATIADRALRHSRLPSSYHETGVADGPEELNWGLFDLHAVSSCTKADNLHEPSASVKLTFFAIVINHAPHKYNDRFLRAIAN